MVTVVALVMSGLTSAGLFTVDVMSASQLRATRLQASEVPPAGSLSGRSAMDGSEWVPRSSEAGEGKLVLFTLAEQGQKGDADFWLDVVARIRPAEPDVEYVGLCVAGKTCALPPGADHVLTLVDSMDPAQMHGAAIAARQGRMFLYRGTRLQSLLTIQSSREVTAADIVRALENSQAQPRETAVM